MKTIELNTDQIDRMKTALAFEIERLENIAFSFPEESRRISFIIFADETREIFQKLNKL